jgi:hypothetical protein
MGFFKDNLGNYSMARMVTFMAAFSGFYNAMIIPWIDNEALLPAAIGLFTAAGVTKAATKFTEAKHA